MVKKSSGHIQISSPKPCHHAIFYLIKAVLIGHLVDRVLLVQFMHLRHMTMATPSGEISHTHPNCTHIQYNVCSSQARDNPLFGTTENIYTHRYAWHAHSHMHSIQFWWVYSIIYYHSTEQLSQWTRKLESRETSNKQFSGQGTGKI